MNEPFRHPDKPEDVKAEKDVRAILDSKFTSLKSWKLPLRCYLDFAFTSSERSQSGWLVNFVVEVKNRKWKFIEYQKYYLEVPKYVKALDYLRSGIDVYIYYSFGFIDNNSQKAILRHKLRMDPKNYNVVMARIDYRRDAEYDDTPMIAILKEECELFWHSSWKT